MTDAERARGRFADRLAGAGLDTQRFVGVLDGAKASHDHTQRAPDDRRLAGNYGVYAGRGAGEDGDGYLVDVDIDDYGTEGERSDALAAVLALPETFTVASPHTDGGTGGHRYYRVEGDVVAEIEAIADGTTNPGPSWGEVRVQNQYVVGPGSQLDGCEKEWCDDCSTADGGHYRVAADRPIATITADDLVDVLVADPAYPKERDSSDRRSPGTSAGEDGDERDAPARDGDGDRPGDETVAERLDHAFEHSPSGRKYRNLYHGNYAAAGFSDRSAAEYALACWLDMWVGFGDRSVVRRLMDRSNAEKWHTDGARASYRKSVLADVGYQDWYADEDPDGDGDGPGAPSADSEPVAVLPDLAPSARAAANGWNWYTADRADDSALSVEDARERTRDAIADAYRSGDRVLVEALPTMGKSYGAVAAAADAGGPITMLTTRGNREQYDQLKEWCDEHGLRAKVLPSVWRDCGTFAGDHGADVAETVKKWYSRGATGKGIHIHYEDETGEPIPCDGPAGDRCSYKSAWQFDADEFDVLIGHYQHAHVNSVTQGRTVVFDESPDGAFETTLDGRLAGAVTRFLQQHRAADALPEDYADLMDARTDDARRADALAWFADRGADRDETLAFDTDGHAVAPLAAFTLLAAAENDLGNGWERAELPDDRGVGLFDRENARVHLLRPPDLRYTSGVVALDGTPTRRLWELALGTRLNHRSVLTDDERVEYVRDTLGLNIVRTTDAVKPYSGDTDHIADEQDAALLEAVADEHDRAPALLTTLTGERSHENAGLYETDGDGGLVDGKGLIGDLAHYGDLKGSNRFASTRLGVVGGSRNFGDGFVKKWGAFAGEAVERGEGKGVDLEYSGIGADVHQHMTHHETLQAVMRFGRDGGGATVYVHTNTLPEWVEDGALAGEGRVVRTYSDGERQVLDALDSDAIGDAWTTAEVAAHPAVEVGESQVRRHLHRLADRDVVTVTVEGNGFVWRDDGLHRVSDHGEVELESVEWDELTAAESDCIARTTTYTWGAVTSRQSSGGDAPGGAVTDAPTGRVATNGGDRPPDDSE